MDWHFPPELPTEPGTYVVAERVTGAPLRLLRWTRLSTAWRLGARVEPVDAWAGPIELPAFPHAEVEHLFAPPARNVPVRRQERRR